MKRSKQEIKAINAEKYKSRASKIRREKLFKEKHRELQEARREIFDSNRFVAPPITSGGPLVKTDYHAKNYAHMKKETPPPIADEAKEESAS